MRTTLQKVKPTLRRRWHWKIPEQGKWLGQVVRGYFGYHAIPTNFRRIDAFRHFVVDLWRRALKRRSQKDNRQRNGFQNPVFSTRGRTSDFSLIIQGKSSVRKLRPPESVRGCAVRRIPTAIAQ